jgi:hypothetical protein
VGTLRVLGQAGDTKVTWDPDDTDQVKTARQRFEDLVKGKKWRAWLMDKTGKKGEPITEFDPNMGAIVIAAPIAGG